MQNGLVFSAPGRGAGESAGPELAEDDFRVGSVLAEDAVLDLELRGVTRSWIRMRRSPKVVELEVSDRWPGFDAGAIGGSGLGIAGMTERLRQRGSVLQILAGVTGPAVTAGGAVKP
jgi:signal transduction histidine kinase